MAKKIVAKIEDGMDRREVHCTTYQMRNPFVQFRDGVARELDVHCYWQHAYAADLLSQGGTVLDVCCGRGLLIPFLRYRGNPPAKYVGVDIKASNATWNEGADPRGNSAPKTDWGFPLVFVESDVETMAKAVQAKVGKTGFDLIVYTSAIEHMQPAAQRASLVECGALSHKGTILYLSCPVTEQGRSGYACQYAAHIYEPTRKELEEWLKAAGWRIKRAIGLCTGVKAIKARLTGSALRSAMYLLEIMPREQALTTIAALYPEAAQEMAYVCVREGK